MKTFVMPTRPFREAYADEAEALRKRFEHHVRRPRPPLTLDEARTLAASVEGGVYDA